MMAVVFLLVSLFATVAFVGLSISSSRRYLWPAALASWMVAFLTSWSVGLYLLVLPFCLVALATGFAAGWIRKPWHELAAVGIGIAAWAIAIETIDDAWLFFPFGWLLGQLPAW